MPKRKLTKECIICLDEKELFVMFACEHVQCIDCYQQIRKKHTVSCPLCRREYSTENSGKMVPKVVIMTFGKYNGRSVDQMHEQDPQYCKWMLRNIHNLNTRNPDIYHRLVELTLHPLGNARR